MSKLLNDNSRCNVKGLFSVSPMLFFILLFIFIFLLTGNIYKISLSVVFTISSVYALYTLKNRSITERIKVFSRGAGQENLMLMLWIFVLAGAFAQTAKDIGAIDAVVRVALHFLPSHLILAGLFVTACFVSLLRFLWHHCPVSCKTLMNGRLIRFLNLFLGKLTESSIEA